MAYRFASFGVSTHSRLKAAGLGFPAAPVLFCRFNTQPPEGGWKMTADALNLYIKFQHTAA